MVNKTNFDPINIDDFIHDPINQEKVQSYPPELVGRFNSFIVTAFDDSMTVEMQIRTMIKWVKENIDVTMSALDNMEAFKQDSMAFQNHVKDTLVNLINQFTDKFDDNLQFEMQEILKQWDDDGYLQSLINEYTNERIDTLFIEKIDKGQAEISDFSQSAREYLANVSTNGFPVVAPDSIGTLNFIDNSVTEEKTSFMKKSTNLFNKNKILLNASINDLGEIVTTNGFALSGLTKVPAGKITIANLRHYALYDLNGQYIPDSKVALESPYTSRVIDIPQNCYIRFSWFLNNLPIDKQQVNIGEVLLPYEQFAIMPIEYLGDQLLNKDNVDFYVPDYDVSTNLHAEWTEISGYYVKETDGTLAKNDNYLTYTINVNPKSEYTFSYHNRSVFYDDNGNFINGIFDNTMGEPKTITTPENAKIMKYSITNTFESDLQINEGATLLPYETPGVEIKGLKSDTVDLLPDVNLSSKIYATVGEELKIFNSNILKDSDDDYNINWICDFGQITSDGFKFKPTTIGNHPLKFELYKKDKLIVSKDTTIVASNKRTTPITYLELGDSTTHAAANAYAITGIKTKLGTNLVTIGTQTDKTETVNYDGRGGWKAETWRTQTDYYGASNPFYNPTKKDFDFGYYLTNTGQTKPDVVVINLGINDVFGVKDGLDVAIQTSINHFRYLIDNIKAYDNTIKVALNLPIPPNASQDVFASNPAVERFQTQWRSKYNNFELVKAMIEEFDETVDLIPIHTVIDTVNNIEDHVHPTETGYYQIADLKTNYLNSI